MANTGVFISTNMKSTTGAARIYDCVATIDVENGMVGYLDELVSGEDVIYEFNPGVSTGKTIVVIDQPAWNYDESFRSNQRKDKFYIEAGTVFRVRQFAMNDEFGINKATALPLSQPDLDVDKFLTVDNTTGKFKVSSSSTSSAPFEAKIIRKKLTGASLITGVMNYGYPYEVFEATVTQLG